MRLVEESGRGQGAYEEPAMLYGSARLGDFRLEMSAYNEGYFSQLDQMAGGVLYGFPVQGTGEQDVFPEFFSMEYKVLDYNITYFGQEPLEGRLVRVEILEDGAELPGPPEAMVPPGLPEERMAVPEQGYYSFHGAGVVICELDGGELTFGNSHPAGGGGNGFIQAGYGWKPDDRVRVQVKVYVDGSLVEEGEVWSEDH